uniref:60S ribosomal protein L34 n=1 Tax=Strombidium inclinatum TaxID=197538 RepID=A0A7S3IM51_9SPIT|mmetsp:Transcript_24141/g.37086  ORF Transcript_24141/g.37086 Transcript_24141/m.37086 type:complete len:123 (+) Transcript_24141:70-438(+)|eukprot:CAMPEP_0170478976 /NCGR_PEP_ID=MMETSP0208-20121228/370_1 /TAXON_ID=197538 /ORGANISM="Strombidium inclinatum, Strain S3" /LENGTH=122 /DNA_ID=CAMNT_0010751311 /DNA_START=46 /DNA_END=414 /DNA_ORIENTATION=+
MLERRITYRRKSSYRTRSNNFKPVKTPGGKLVMHLLKKHTKGTQMQGVKVARPHDFKRLTASKRSVSRAYGGNLNATEVKEKIMRAFLIDEFKYFKKMSSLQGTQDKKDKKKKTGDKKKAKK